MLFGCIVLFCVIAGIGYSYQGDAFYLVGGYSVLWLLVLYVIGACLKKSGLFSRTNAWKLFAIMAVCLGATYAWHPVIWNYLKNRFLFVAHYPTWAQLPFVLAVALAAFIAGVFLDWLRTLLFRLLHVDAGCAALERMIRNIVDKFSRFLLKRF